MYGRNPEVFVANRTSPGEIVLFGLIIALAIPLVAALLLLVADRIGGRAPETVYMSFVVLLSAGIGLVVSRQVFPENTVLAVAGALVVAVLVVLVDRWFSKLISYFALALPVVLVLFIATSASARLIWEEPEGPEATTQIENPAELVMIQLDEFPLASIMEPDGTINQTLFPNFSRLAEEGNWYRNAISNSIATTQSIPAILTGKLGEKGLSPSSVDHPDNLFSLLAGTYEMHVIEWVADMCPEETCPDYAGRAPARFGALLRDVGVVYGHLTLPLALREQIPSIDNAWKGFLGDGGAGAGSRVEVDGLPVPDDNERVEWVDWVQRLADGIDGGSEPILHYAHLEAPHVPWKTNPSGTHYERPEEYTEVEGVEGDGHWTEEPEPALLGFRRHLYQLGFLDRVLGRLFDEMDSEGIWDESMVVVVADHGASFVPGEHRRWPHDDNRDDLYRVPLFIKYPNQTSGEVVDAPAYGIDILPTIVDALGIQADWDFDGMSLLDVEGTDRPHDVIWWCCNGEGISTDLEVLFDQVARNHEWVPDQSSWMGVAGAGENAELIGVPAASLTVEEVEELRWSLDLGKSLAELHSGNGMVQTLLTGRIELPEGTESDDLVVVVNGEVGGTGYIVRDTATGGVIRALISEQLLDDGHNEIDLLVPGAGGTWLAGSPDVLTLELADEDGRALDIRTEGSKRIQVDEVGATEAGWEIGGWAADVTSKQVAETIYVFVGDDLLAAGAPSEENSNVVRWFESDDLLVSGFTFEISNEDIPEGVEQLTVVAEFEDGAVADPVFLGG